GRGAGARSRDRAGRAASAPADAARRRRHRPRAARADPGTARARAARARAARAAAPVVDRLAYRAPGARVMNAAPASPDRARCVIVGGGWAGLSAAVALARAGARPLLLEAAR